jgi:DNA-binding PucR family transcriptional regulator
MRWVGRRVSHTLGCLIEPGRKAPWLLLETLETLLQENGNVVRA